jgi:hypothetical protein
MPSADREIASCSISKQLMILRTSQAMKIEDLFRLFSMQKPVDSPEFIAIYSPCQPIRNCQHELVCSFLWRHVPCSAK